MSITREFIRGRFQFFGVFLFFLFCAAGTGFGQVRVSDLKNPDVVQGCSCGFQTPLEAKKRNSRRWLFLSELGTKEGWMNLNGKDAKLRLIRTTENKRRRRTRVGDRFYEEYGAPGIRVRIDYLTKRVCAPGDEGCEVTDYDATIRVTIGKASRTLRATGYCGC